MTLSIRCKAKSGHCVLNELTTDSTLSDLLDLIYRQCNIDSKVTEVCIKSGYPPKSLDLSNIQQKISDSGIENGDSLIVEEKVRTSIQRERVVAIDSLLTAQEEMQGFVTRQTIPSNNSCLFLSVDFCLNNGKLNLGSASVMRQIIVNAVREQPHKYTEAVLEKSPDEYCAWITSDSSWGGAIELSVLCGHYNIQVDVVDTQTGRIDVFSYLESRPTERIFLIYDGIHYDSLALETLTGALRTRFPIVDDKIYRMAIELGQEAKQSKQYTDLSAFQLQCLDCRVYLRGQREAQHHAKQTSHVNFGEVQS